MKSLCLMVAIVLAMQQDEATSLRDRLDNYLLAYEPQLSTLVADERMTQRDAPNERALVNVAPDTKNRSIVSEVAFIGLPGNAVRLGFRRVVRVNGKDVKDKGTPLAVLLTDGAADDYDQARLLLADSASANSGSPRTT